MLVRLLEVGLSGAAVNIITTRGAIFRRLRVWLDGRSVFLGDLIHCPLCFGTWVGLALAAATDLWLFGLWGPLDWFLSGMAATSIIVSLSFIIYASMHRILIDPLEYPPEEGKEE